MRPSKVMANAFKAGFHRVTHRAPPFPVGSRDREVRYKLHSRALRLPPPPAGQQWAYPSPTRPAGAPPSRRRPGSSPGTAAPPVAPLTSLPLSMCLTPTKKALAQSPICDRARVIDGARPACDDWTQLLPAHALRDVRASMADQGWVLDGHARACAWAPRWHAPQPDGSTAGAPQQTR